MRNIILTDIIFFQRREDSRASKTSTLLLNENANNNIFKGSRRISTNSTFSSPSLKSYGGYRKGSKRAVSLVHNASFRQGTQILSYMFF